MTTMSWELPLETCLGPRSEKCQRPRPEGAAIGAAVSLCVSAVREGVDEGINSRRIDS